MQAITNHRISNIRLMSDRLRGCWRFVTRRNESRDLRRATISPRPSGRYWQRTEGTRHERRLDCEWRGAIGGDRAFARLHAEGLGGPDADQVDRDIGVTRTGDRER